MLGAAPTLPLSSLDTLWVQLAGTLCNLQCAHCLVTSGPREDRHRMMPADEVLGLVREAAKRGARDVYFTGGEPFLHPDIEALCARTLELLPLTVLTNGMLIGEARASRLGALFSRSRYSFEIRISLDGLDAESNDRLRGRGNFEAALEGFRRLIEAGMEPILTVVDLEDGTGSFARRAAFLELLRARGAGRARLKMLPLFHVGRQVGREGVAVRPERLRDGDLDAEVLARLPCATSRIVTSQGVFACPIRIDDPEARTGDTLAEGLGPIRLSSGACYTCHVTGATCAT